MSDISNQLIKDSYDYVLQSDLSTGIVYRIGGGIPVNPTFLSGITINSTFTFADGSQQNGYVLTSDASGNASWKPASAATPSSGVTSITVGNGLSANSSTGAVTIVFTGSTGISGEYLPLSGGTVTGDTIFQSGLTATTVSATTYYNLPVSAVTSGAGISASTTNGSVTIINTAPDQTVTITGGTNIEISGNYPNFGVNYTGQTSFPYLPLSGGTLTGGLVANSGLTANTISATTYQNLPLSLTATTQSGNTLSIVNSTGGTSTYTLNAVTGGSYSNGTITLSGTGNVNGNTITGFSTSLTGEYLPLSGGTVTGKTIFQSGLTANTLTITGLTSSTDSNVVTIDGSGVLHTYPISGLTGSSSTSSGAYLPLSGGTVTGNTIFQSGLTANTISATTYLNVSAVTGGSYSNGTITLSGTGNVNGNTITGLTKYFISASTPTGVTIYNGDRWYNTNNGIELVYINDGDSTQWVQPSNTPGPPGYSNLMITSGITTSAATLDININYYGVNYNGQVNLTLPNPSGYDGYNFTIKDEGGYAATHRIRLTSISGLIDRNNYVDINLRYVSLHLMARNNNWWII